MIVLDTCTLIWRSFDSQKISPVALKAIEESTEIGVSTISVWEIGIKIKNKKLSLPLTVEHFVERLHKLDGFKMFAVDEWIWMESLQLPWKHRDPADRVIVATAKKLGCPIVTSDQVIRSFYPKVIW